MPKNNFEVIPNSSLAPIISLRRDAQKRKAEEATRRETVKKLAVKFSDPRPRMPALIPRPVYFHELELIDPFLDPFGRNDTWALTATTPPEIRRVQEKRRTDSPEMIYINLVSPEPEVDDRKIIVLSDVVVVPARRDTPPPLSDRDARREELCALADEVQANANPANWSDELLGRLRALKPRNHPPNKRLRRILFTSGGEKIFVSIP